MWKGWDSLLDDTSDEDHTNMGAVEILTIR